MPIVHDPHSGKFMPGPHAKGGGGGGGGAGGDVSEKPVEIDQQYAVKDPSKWENTHYSDWQSKLSTVEIDAIRKYTGSDYIEINSHLRSNVPIDSAVQSHIPHLDTALNKAPRTPEVIHVARTIDAKLVQDLNLQVGGVFQDRGYMSTTMQKSGMPGALISIKIPAGSKGAPISNISVYKAEAEFLLPRNSRLKITRMGVDKRGRPAIEAELLQD